MMRRVCLLLPMLCSACGWVGIERLDAQDAGTPLDATGVDVAPEDAAMRDSTVDRNDGLSTDADTTDAARTDAEIVDAMLMDTTPHDAGADTPSRDAGADTGPRTTYYISPTGSDSGDGSRDGPYRTFSFALTQLTAGNTLLLLPGTYANSTGTGLLNVDCSSSGVTCEGGPCANGAPGMPIVIRAETERSAHLQAEAGDADLMALFRECNDYVVEGLTLRGADIDGNPWHSMNITASANVVARRNLFTGNNRFTNSHLLLVFQSRDVLLEENELYDFHRVGISVYQSQRVTARRNYANARDHADIPGGRDSGHPASGDTAYACHHSASCLFENNVSEGDVDTAFGLTTLLALPEDAPGAGDQSRYFGNLIHGARYGFLGSSVCESMPDCSGIDERAVHDVQVRNNVLVDIYGTSILFRGVSGLDVHHNTAFGRGLRVDVPSRNGSLVADAQVTHNLVIQSPDFSFVVLDQDTWFLGLNNGFGPGTLLDTGGDATGVGVNTETDPQLGACRHRIPTGTPMAGAGDGDADIGANVVFRHVDGALTSDLLWQGDDAFPCGAEVAGINDSGNRCATFHQRLNIGSGCARR